MSKIELIERDVEQLDDQSFAVFREWFIAYEQARWDRQIAKDSAAGKLDRVIGEAMSAQRAGKTTPL